MDEGTTAAGVLTQSKTASAPVLWCRKSLKKGKARVLVVNSGNANAFTGKKGAQAVEITAEHACLAAGCKQHEVYLASTGVIGEPLDASKFAHLLMGLATAREADRFEDAARAIMTTDTYPKLATRTAMIGDTEVTINGFCKGAGMIAPDMATMLCFMFTDAAIPAKALQELLSRARGDDVQLHDRRRRYVDQRHLPAVCHWNRGQARPEARRQAPNRRSSPASRQPCTT